MSDEVYRSRWGTCDDCELVMIVERDDDRGIPDEGEWDYFPSCALCGGTIAWGNADFLTQREAESRSAARRAWSAIARAFFDAADDLEGATTAAEWTRYIGSPGWLRDKAAKAQDRAEAGAR